MLYCFEGNLFPQLVRHVNKRGGSTAEFAMVFVQRFLSGKLWIAADGKAAPEKSRLPEKMQEMLCEMMGVSDECNSCLALKHYMHFTTFPQLSAFSLVWGSLRPPLPPPHTALRTHFVFSHKVSCCINKDKNSASMLVCFAVDKLQSSSRSEAVGGLGPTSRVWEAQAGDAACTCPTEAKPAQRKWLSLRRNDCR